MEYSQAKKIRDTPLSHLISAGPGGAIASTKAALGLKMKAKLTGMQEKIDPMYWAKKIGGRGLSAFVGRAFGRKQSSINYFIGKNNRNGYATRLQTMEQPSATPVQQTGPTIDSSAVVLQEMFTFMKSNRAEDIKQRETEQSFAEERETEKQRQHEEFIKVLEKFTGKPTATLEKKGEGMGLLQHIRDIISGLTDKFKELVESLSWITKLGPILMNVARFFLTSPIGIALLAGVALYKLLEYGVENTDNMKAVTPEQAKNILEGVTNERDLEVYGGREKLTRIAQRGSEDAKALLESGDKEKIRQAGGKDLLEKSVSQGTQILSEEATTAKRVTVTPRPDTTGGKNAARAKAWDNKFGNTHNPDGTSKLTATKTVEPPKTDVKAAPKVEQKTTVTTPPPSTPVSKLSTENSDLNTQAVMTPSIIPPVVTNTTSSGVIPDRPVTATASQRDETHILRRTLEASSVTAY